MFSALIKRTMLNQTTRLYSNATAIADEQSLKNAVEEKNENQPESLNSVNLIGRVGLEPRTYTTKDEKKRITFSLATERFFKMPNNPEFTKRTDWHNVAVYSPILQKFVEENVRKGTKLQISGHIEYDKYQNKDGVTKYITKIIAKEIALKDNKDHGETINDN